MSSRRAKSSEIGAAVAKGVNMKPTIVAYDGILMIVNAGNLVKSLTKNQVEQIFTGAITGCSAVGGRGGKLLVRTAFFYTNGEPTRVKEFIDFTVGPKVRK